MTSITISAIHPSSIIDLKSHETILIKGGSVEPLDLSKLNAIAGVIIDENLLKKHSLEDLNQFIPPIDTKLDIQPVTKSAPFVQSFDHIPGLSTLYQW